MHIIIIIIVSQSWQGKTTEQFKIAITSHQLRHRGRTFMQQPALEYLLLPRCLPMGSCSARYSVQSSPSLSRQGNSIRLTRAFWLQTWKTGLWPRRRSIYQLYSVRSTHRSAWLCPPAAAQLLLVLLLCSCQWWWRMWITLEIKKSSGWSIGRAPSLQH